MRRVALYGRVSTDGQSTENQLRELRPVAERHGWTVVGEYVDHGISGTKGRKGRPAFDRMCQALARKEFDVIAVWSVDRLGRSLQDLTTFLSEVHAKKVNLYLHQQGLDTSTPAGTAMFQMMGIFAEFERSMIVERVQAGLARARALGVRLGRPVSNAKPDEVITLKQQGLSVPQIAKHLRCSTSTVKRLLRKRDSSSVLTNRVNSCES